MAAVGGIRAPPGTCSSRSQKASQTVEVYAAELKRLYDKAHANRDEGTSREDLLRKFLDSLFDEKG